MNKYDPRYMQLKEEKLKSVINKQKTVITIADVLFIEVSKTNTNKL